MKAKNLAYNEPQVDQMIKQSFPFEEFNDGQFEAIKFAVMNLLMGKKHVVIEAPTGVGKSVIAITIHRVMSKLTFLDAKMEAWRTQITTTTKGLQDQYVGDGMIDADLRSKTNYKCPLGHTFGSAECAIARKRKMCRPTRDCEYLVTRQNWLVRALIRTTNNAMLLEMPADMCASGDNRVDLTVVDECHKLDKSLLNHAKLRFNPNLINGVIKIGIVNAPEIKAVIEKILIYFIRLREGEIFAADENFRELCADVLELATESFEHIDKIFDEYTDKLQLDALTNLQNQVAMFSAVVNAASLINRGDITDMILFECKQNEVTLKPIFPKDVSQYSLFSKSDQVVHMSATICGMEAYYERLGIPKEDVAIYNINNPIPVDNRLVHYLPKVRMSGKATEEKARELTQHIDDIYENMHLNENALIHTVSYTLADMIMKYSRFKDRMMIGGNKVGRDKTMKALRDGAKDGRGVIVLSAAMEEGWDLKGDLCRMNVVAKVPYEFMGDPLVKFVSNKEPAQYFREAILRIVQASGRCTRGVSDHGATYILDESFGSLVSRNQDFFPKWFLESIRYYE